ncbi:MAG: hypothetical protein DCC44_01085 [Acidobacteria bacterium]|nr:MAG: hypothetical protein DCC44_01085 [Acidobacteriota bacterium]
MKGIGKQFPGEEDPAGMERGANFLNLQGTQGGRFDHQTSATEAGRLHKVSSVVTGFFRDMDRSLEEMKPKY